MTSCAIFEKLGGRGECRIRAWTAREYLEWITEAKTDATRQKRLAMAIAWMAEGKGHNGKYEPAPKR